ncbi:MAG TPA: amidohydrolase family protein [Gaiellaceae bacterium]
MAPTQTLRSELYDDEEIRPWYEHARALVPRAALFDAHGHIGFNDPDGFTFSAEQLAATLTAADARGIAIPMHEPDGYPPANDYVLEAAAASDGRVVPFCRVDPKADPIGEAKRCLDAGARGIKLHPRAEGFELSDPEVEPIFALAHERRLPILIHAGRGIPTLARDAVSLAGRYPEARVILAHAAICDLNWIWRDAGRYPNLLFDTAWWHPTDLAALFALIPPGQLVFGSDLPYFTPFMSSTMAVRFGLQVGLTPSQLATILGRQTERLLEGGEPIDVGPPAGTGRLGYSVLLERLTSVLTLAVGRMLMGRTGYEPLALARLACDLGELHSRDAHVAKNVLALLHRQEQFVKENPGNGPPLGAGIRTIMLAACVARTPDVPLPHVPELTEHHHVRAAARSGHRAFHETGIRRVEHPPADLARSSAADHLIAEHHGH